MNNAMNEHSRNLRINNTIFLMHLAANAYASRHGLTREQFIAEDDRYHFLRLISKCPDYFDPLPEEEIVKELEQYALRIA